MVYNTLQEGVLTLRAQQSVHGVAVSPSGPSAMVPQPALPQPGALFTTGPSLRLPPLKWFSPTAGHKVVRKTLFTAHQ